jgi:hypothetical protein
VTLPPAPELPQRVELASPHWAEQLARLLDDGFRVPGTKLRFGLDPILGFVAPGAGDVLTGLCNVALVVMAVRQGVPAPIVFRMVVNVLADVLIGALPIAGDVFDFVWKATRRNLLLIEAHRTGKPVGVLNYLLLGAFVVAILAALLLPVALLIATLAWLLSG